MLKYYGKFLSNLSTHLASLYGLLKKNSRCMWGPDQKEAFQNAKSMLTSSKVLTHYDPTKLLILSCNASLYGVGAVLSHQMGEGEHPIAFASRSSEKNYSQIDKEALAIVVGVKLFHQYVFGQRFTIKSDHKPLQYLLGEKKGIPAMASARLQC